MPRWGRVAKYCYTCALAAFVLFPLVGRALGLGPSDGSRLYAVWIGAAVIGLLALGVWLIAEFVAGRREVQD